MFPLLLEPSHLVNSARVNKSYGEILIPPADIELQEIFYAVLPFIALQIIGMLMVMFIPDIALWFPKYLSG